MQKLSRNSHRHLDDDETIRETEGKSLFIIGLDPSSTSSPYNYVSTPPPPATPPSRQSLECRLSGLRISVSAKRGSKQPTPPPHHASFSELPSLRLPLPFTSAFPHFLPISPSLLYHGERRRRRRRGINLSRPSHTHTPLPNKPTTPGNHQHHHQLERTGPPQCQTIRPTTSPHHQQQQQQQ